VSIFSILPQRRVIEVQKNDNRPRLFVSLFFLRNKGHLDGLLSEYLLYYNVFRLHEAIDGQTPNAVFYNIVVPKPKKNAKQIRAPIEEIRMGNGHLRAYRLKEAAYQASCFLLSMGQVRPF
jgi:hypothetical protein